MIERYFIAFLIGRVSIWMAGVMLSVALGWHIYLETKEPIYLALIGLMQILPTFAFFIITGVVIDRFQRKYILLICTVIEFVAFTGIFIAMLFDSIPILLVFLMLLVHGVARAFQIPSEHALLPNIVSKENLEKAVAITSTVSNLAKTTGPLIAGLLIALTDRYIYGICIIIVLISFLAYLFLPMFKIHTPAEFGLKPFLSGIKFVAKKKILLAIILLDLFIVLLGSVEALLPIYAADILNVGPNGLGLMRGMPAIGAVITGILLSNIGPLRHCGKLLFAAFGICSLSVLVFGLSDIFWLSLVALFIYGATDMLSVNIRFTLAQTITPDAVRGRVSAIFATSTASSNQLGEFRAGMAATAVGPIGATIIGGILGLIICISGIFKFPMLWKLDKISDLRNESNEFKKE